MYKGDVDKKVYLTLRSEVDCSLKIWHEKVYLSSREFCAVDANVSPSHRKEDCCLRHRAGKYSV